LRAAQNHSSGTPALRRPSITRSQAARTRGSVLAGRESACAALMVVVNGSELPWDFWSSQPMRELRPRGHTLAKQRPRHESTSGIPRAPQYPAHGALLRIGPDAVQGLLAELACRSHPREVMTCRGFSSGSSDSRTFRHDDPARAQLSESPVTPDLRQEGAPPNHSSHPELLCR
jgi:hypothetical protein